MLVQKKNQPQSVETVFLKVLAPLDVIYSDTSSGKNNLIGMMNNIIVIVLLQEE